MGTLAGIGFTMSIFTTMLAFTDSGVRDIAKISILSAVVGSVIVSYFYFRSIYAKKIASPALPRQNQYLPDSLRYNNTHKNKKASWFRMLFLLQNYVIFSSSHFHL